MDRRSALKATLGLLASLAVSPYLPTLERMGMADAAMPVGVDFIGLMFARIRYQWEAVLIHGDVVLSDEFRGLAAQINTSRR